MRIIGYISDCFSIIGAIISALIWLKIRYQNKKLMEIAGQKSYSQDYDKMIEYHNGINSLLPCAFCLSLTDRTSSIRDDVQKHLDHKKLKMPIAELNFEGLTHENFSDFVEDLKKKRRELQARGVTEIHLFISGPLQAAVMVGAMFDNWIPVKIYNFNPQTRNYEYWGPLLK
ncbi:MAG: SAVED domain-containing protein [Candidatus Omnitrophota bacterium]